ncbi:KpsF/GutQ family sugar-phosphate isomerase [Haliea sp. AH-315-K21]|uniref:Arabinose 5-phosphate isomerase n=1 Tax=SAR86 cluster bacterium TaxID=2030880 RepID=A0A2A5C9Q4_9GAMM|nr:KpsF/GutQ family sugar-phosphate isomerase [Haliea sp. AH-315-K21]PCJ40624.1 MAG: D-arabinose 5-phosphate isomerase [SAR86 cluster bacterium]
MTKNSFIETALRTISLEQDAVAALKTRIDNSFNKACTLMLDCTGHIIVMGMGKSGHIANKIAATLASTGTPAHFVHPAEASHGDIGMITEKDVILALSNSGTTEELLSILPVLKRKGVPLITMTGNANSALAESADVNLDASVEIEACPLGLAPTTSTTVSLVLGDALAMALLEARGFTAEDFAFSHPGGNLGRRLLLKVENVMHSDLDIPIVSTDTPISETLLEVSAKKLGMTTIKDDAGNLAGVFTDGDLRRVLDQNKDLQLTRIDKVMTRSFRSIGPNSLASEAAKIMQDNEIYSLVVLDDEQKLAGIITMHDLLKANVV